MEVLATSIFSRDAHVLQHGQVFDAVSLFLCCWSNSAFILFDLTPQLDFSEFPVDVEDLASKDTVLVDDYVECGDDYCYYGGTCNEYEVNGETEYSCDCSTAFSETDLYAGRSCQYRSTSFCSSLPDTDSLAGTEFCTNYGQCLDGGGCGCPAGYEGLRCEFAQYPDQDFEDNLAPNDGKQSSEDDDGYQCRLQCYNGGICAKGAKDLGSLQKTVEHVDHLNKTYDKVFFEHCVCQDGWVGLQCEHVADICGDSEHVCLHGSTCVKNNQHHSCDCSQADERIVGADQPLFAGDSCQHPATDICIQGEDYQGRPMYFCVNNGVCKDYVTGEEDPPGCDCPAGWIGPHCEIRTRSDISRTKQGVQIFLLVLILTLVTAALIASCKYFIRNQSSSHDSQDCMPFRRRRRVRALNSLDEQRSNLAPARTPSDAAPRTPTFSSSSDPIAAGMELPPDDEPKDEPYDQYQYEPEAEPDLCRDEPVLFNIGPPRDEDGNQLHNVDFV